MKKYTILAIETSCDETSVAVLRASGGIKNPRFQILSNIVSSQVKIHAKWGGVVPTLAKREHEKNLVPILLSTLKEAGYKKMIRRLTDKNQKQIIKILERETELQKQFLAKILPIAAPDIDAVAVTNGPGLEPALWVGINFAKALAALWEKPLIPVNHLAGHIVSSLLTDRPNISEKQFAYPALALIVSGGHTELVLIKTPLKYKVLGETRDDAAGEAFDKAAKLLGLEYPGGPAISKIAAKGDPRAIPLPRPMIKSQDFDFSFAGLKTAVLYSLQKEKSLSGQKINNYAASFEQAVVDVLVAKTAAAVKKHKPKSLILGGGVVANQKLRGTILTMAAAAKNLQIFLPDMRFTGDNAAMIAAAAYSILAKKRPTKKIAAVKAEGSLSL